MLSFPTGVLGGIWNSIMSVPENFPSTHFMVASHFFSVVRWRHSRSREELGPVVQN